MQRSKGRRLLHDVLLLDVPQRRVPATARTLQGDWKQIKLFGHCIWLVEKQRWNWANSIGAAVV